jgi:hypothetical protein
MAALGRENKPLFAVPLHWSVALQGAAGSKVVVAAHCTPHSHTVLQ